MHELGIVDHVCRQIEAIGQREGLSQVASVTLEIGEVSGVVPSYLESCWNWTVKKPEAGILQGANLICENIAAVTACEDCNRTYPTLEHGKQCPFCGGENTFLVSGNELNIKEIEAC